MFMLRKNLKNKKRVYSSQETMNIYETFKDLRNWKNTILNEYMGISFDYL